jgi:ATP-binding cassette subfamily B protein
MNKPEIDKIDWSERIGAFKNLRPFFIMIWNTSPKLALINITLRLFKSLVPIISLYIGKLIIDEVLALVATPNPSLSHLTILIASEFAVLIISDLLNRGIGLSDNLLGDLFANNSSVKLMEHAGKLDLAQFEDSQFYDKLERARRQTLGRTVLMSQVLEQFQNTITILSLLVGMVAFNPWLILLIVVAIIPAFLGESHFNSQNYSLVRSWTPQRRELDYLRFTGASDETAKEVKIFGLTSFLAKRFKKVADAYYEETKKIAIKRAFWGMLLAALGTLGYYVAYGLIVFDTVQGIITVGTLTFLAGSFSRLKSLFEGILNKFSTVSEGAMYLQDFFDFFNIEPKVSNSSGNVPFPKVISKGFSFENVSFQYDKNPKPVIENLSFELPAGQKLALVGENGAGKTTLVKLLVRLYDPTSGIIRLDGIDLRDYNAADLQGQTSVIFQDFIKYQLNARENIGTGNVEALDELDTIKAAAGKSLASTVIEELPDKYDQMIGRRFHNGIDLSGGQWQKIALGRAYMRDAQLLILDEPTAALDARAEHEVFERFAELTKGKTAVLISHRFSTVRMADKILVLEKGRKLEYGTHEELILANGKYAELFNLQAKGYA